MNNMSTSPKDQQMGNQQQSGLSSKNLTILEDQMNQEAMGYKKLNLYSSYCQDSELKGICDRAAQMHKNHFNKLYQYLNNHQQ